MIIPYIKHCVKSVIIWNYAGPYSVQTWENKNQNNSEYGHFSCSDRCRINPLPSRVFFLHPLKISENCRFFYIFWTYKWVNKKVEKYPISCYLVETFCFRKNNFMKDCYCNSWKYKKIFHVFLLEGLPRRRTNTRDVLEIINFTNCCSWLFFNKNVYEHTFSVSSAHYMKQF